MDNAGETYDNLVLASGGSDIAWERRPNCRRLEIVVCENLRRGLHRFITR